MDVAALKSIDLILESGGHVEGLVSVSKPPKNLPTGEKAFIERAAAIGNVDYVFFRRLNDIRASHPAAFVIDNSDERLSKSELAKLHNDLWLNGGAPLAYVAWSTQVDILSCARGPDFWEGTQRTYNPAHTIEIASDIARSLSQARRFSANRLADGTFWEDPQNQHLADHEKAAHESLIQAIVETDAEIGGEKNPTLRRLLLLVVLIKYLEDRQVFPGARWFGHFHGGARTFLDVLASENPGTVLRLLGNLEAKFNGDVFSVPDEAKLTAKSLRQFSELVNAKTLKRQRYLWEQFSFAHVPVEVISHLYQRFVQGSTAVYTPPFLASLLLDFAMPYGRLTGKERVLDPACGSGVFLVGAFRRLVNTWRSKNKWAQPTVDTLKSILRNQIFGVELDPTAVDLTAFSLALAVCDSLQPNVIWNELRFDRLRGHNLHEDDFFNFAIADVGGRDKSLGKFDVVIGNPPFESDFSEPAKLINQQFAGERGSIPDKQIAYLFLDQAVRTLKINGIVCLIQPSGYLYNVKVKSFRDVSLQSTRVILDFASIRNLFDRADTKIVAVLSASVDAAEPTDIKHLTFRRTTTVHQRLAFELDHYDCHSVPRHAIHDGIWKYNLLGGGRISKICGRFSELDTFKSYVKKNPSWTYGEGFNAGTKVSAAYLTDLPYVPESELRDSEIDISRLRPLSDSLFEAPRKEALYVAPLMLVGETLDLPVGILHFGRVAYSKQIVGLSAPKESRTEIQNIFRAFLQRKLLYRFWIAVQSSRAMASMATSILKADIDSLPYSTDAGDFELGYWEKAIAEDVLKFFAEYVRVGQNSQLLRKNADADNLTAYSSLYCRMLGSIYDNLHAAEPVFLDGLICQPFYFGNEPSIEWLGPDCGEQLQSLVFDTALESLRTIRVVRIYHENVIFIVKPDRLRYWIRSTAIRDADDTLVELQQQGY